MYIFTIFLPLINCFWIGTAGFFLGRKGCCYLGSLSLFLSLLISLFIFFEVGLNGSIVSLKLYNWLIIDIYNLEIGFLFDSVSSIMLIIILSISFFVYIYSITYMMEDPYLTRFLCYLSLFTFFMLILVTADNFLQLFMGWEGVGLCSYLLINFWFTRILANKAALKAMIMNRIADIFFLFGIILVFLIFRTTDYIIVFNLIPFILENNSFFLFKIFNTIDLICFFFFIGSIGKSAQIGFHTWLPDAMEGPTPVSALLHAATMVTAGVFLNIRCSFFFEFSENILNLIFLFGSITTFFSGFVALFQYDIKKVIAYSTCSQLGYMFISCGLSNYSVALFHLFNHAFFKALLFLSAGYIIHAFNDEQDMRKYCGNLFKFMPFTYFCFLVGSLAIMGFPFLTGFYSKEIIIEFAYKSYIIDSKFLYIINLLSAFLTGLYSWRLLLHCFLNTKNNIYKSIYKNFFKNKVEFLDSMFYSMLCLSIFSIFIGFFFSDIFIGMGTFFWNNSIFVLPFHNNLLNNENLSSFLNLIPLIIIFLSLYIWYIIVYYYDEKRTILFLLWIYKWFLIILSVLKLYHNILYIYIFLFYNFLYHFYQFLCFVYFYYFLIFKKIGYHAFYFNKLYNLFFQYIYKILYLCIYKYIEKGIFDFLWVIGFYKIVWYFISKLGYYFFFSPVVFISLLFMFFYINLLGLFFLYHIDILSFFFSNIGFFFIIIWYILSNEIK